MTVIASMSSFRHRPEPYVPIGPIEVPAGDPDRLAMLVLLDFTLEDRGDPDVMLATLPDGWRASDVSGPGDHREPRGMLLDAAGRPRVTLIARERSYRAGVQAVGTCGPVLTIRPRYELAFRIDTDLSDGRGCWVILDGARRRTRQHDVARPAYRGKPVDPARPRLAEIHRRACEQYLRARWPDHENPLAYW